MLIRLLDQERLEPSMDRFFRKLGVDKPVTRINFFVQTRKEEAVDKNDPDELGWATSSMGDEDAFVNGEHGRAKEEEEETPVEWMRLRVERQTLVRLPQSGAVLFTIRVYMTEIRQIKEAARLASALRSLPSDVAEYKGKNRWEAVLEYLDENTGKQ